MPALLRSLRYTFRSLDHRRILIGRRFLFPFTLQFLFLISPMPVSLFSVFNLLTVGTILIFKILYSLAILRSLLPPFPRGSLALFPSAQPVH
jgi:hypothetical protein